MMCLGLESWMGWEREIKWELGEIGGMNAGGMIK